MTPEELERLAREAGGYPPGNFRNHWAITEPALTRFAALVRAQALEDAARVAAATVCDRHLPTNIRIYGTKAAEAIRALAAPAPRPADRAEL